MTLNEFTASRTNAMMTFAKQVKDKSANMNLFDWVELYETWAAKHK